MSGVYLELNEYDTTLKFFNSYFRPVVSVMTREIKVGGAKKEAQIKNILSLAVDKCADVVSRTK